MADNRILIRGKSVRGNEYWSSGRGVAGAEADIVALRNEMRSVFPSPRFKVSDIAKWTSSVSATARGYAFILRDTTHTQEFAFCFMASTSTNNWIYEVFGGTASNAATHLKQVSNTALNNPGAVGDFRPMVIFNHSTTNTFAMGFTDTTNLTYGTGDFTAPSTNPSTNLTTLNSWLPNANAAPAVPSVFQGAYSANSASAPDRYDIMYDLDIGFLRISYAQGQHPSDGLSVFSGKIFRPNSEGGLANISDTQVHGVVSYQVSGTTSASIGSNISSNVLRTFYCRDNGTTVQTDGFSTLITPAFSRSTYLDGSNVRIRPIEIQSTGYIKGFLDPRMISEALPSNDGAFFQKRISYPDADNPLIKDHYLFCSAYKKDAPMIGFTPDAGLPT